MVIALLFSRLHSHKKLPRVHNNFWSKPYFKKIREKRDAILRIIQQYKSTPSQRTVEGHLRQTPYTLEYERIIEAAKKESLTVLTTPRSVTTTHSTIAADKNKNSGKYSEEISDLEEKL
jgi:hypothetical protein